MSLKAFIQKQKYFSFYIIDLSIVSKEQYDKIIEIFEECLGDIYIETYNSLTIIYYHYFDGASVEDVLPTLTEDFGICLKMFHGFKMDLNRINDVYKIIQIYINHSFNKNKQFTNLRSLILDTLENEKDFNILKEIVLHPMIDDPKLKEIIMGMFDSNLNVSKTASIVYMHRNTINYKLDIIEQEMGLNMQNFHDAVAMYILLKKD